MFHPGLFHQSVISDASIHISIPVEPASDSDDESILILANQFMNRSLHQQLSYASASESSSLTVNQVNNLYGNHLVECLTYLYPLGYTARVSRQWWQATLTVYQRRNRSTSLPVYQLENASTNSSASSHSPNDPSSYLSANEPVNHSVGGSVQTFIVSPAWLPVIDCHLRSVKQNGSANQIVDIRLTEVNQ